MAKLKQFWITLHSSLWFVPTAMVLAAITLALGLIEIDRGQHQQLAHDWPRLFAASSDGSRAMLAAIASSAMTVAGVVFSITIVALSQASTQYSPRVLRNFMRDRGNQVVLGAFVGIFAYCLVVLRNISRDREGEFVPTLAAFFGFLLALLGIGLLIYFIHHVASSLQASDIIRRITRETMNVTRALFPETCEIDVEQKEKAAVNPGKATTKAEDWQGISALSFGYIQQVDREQLFRLACERQITIRMEVGVGEFAMEGRPLVSICGAAEPDERLVREVNRNYAIDGFRTIDQDPGFGIRQLVDVAVKALSPGINDTTTAVTAVDHLGQILGEMAPRRLDEPHRFEGTELRLIVRGMTFRRLLNSAFEQIIENARGNKAVFTHLVNSLHRMAAVTNHPARRRALAEQAEVLAELISHIRSTRARLEANAHFVRVRDHLEKLARAHSVDSD